MTPWPGPSSRNFLTLLFFNVCFSLLMREGGGRERKRKIEREGEGEREGERDRERE